MQGDLIEQLLRVSVDPELIRDVGKCTWDNKSMVLTTPTDAEEAGKKKLEDAAWCQQDYGVKMSNSGKKYSKGEKLLAPKNLYQVEDNHTYTTLNERPGTHAGLPGDATADLGKNKPRPSIIDFDEGSDEESALSNVTNMSNLTAPDEYTREELIEML